jgi:predicted thioesterase
MENASMAAIQRYMSDGLTTVGVEVSVRHLAPTPVGMHVRALAVLEQIRGSRLKFKVEAWDEKERIGEGQHARVIIDIARFSRRLQAKASAVNKRPNEGAKGHSNTIRGYEAK